MAESPVDQDIHAAGEKILLEEFGAFDLTLEKRIEIEDGGSTICRKHGRAWLAKRVDAHVGLSMKEQSIVETDDGNLVAQHRPSKPARWSSQTDTRPAPVLGSKTAASAGSGASIQVLVQQLSVQQPFAALIGRDLRSI
jgi:hypothetical protein